jgi:Mn2+/Fe2+ NRAMP family transporter
MHKQHISAKGFRYFLHSVGPGIFLIGYVIGTGSVTTMVIAGANYGMQMTWALALSCALTYFLVFSISRLTIISGHTLIHLVRKNFGDILALAIITGLMITVIASVMGVTAIASDILREWIRTVIPGSRELNTLISSIVFIGILYYLFWFGRHGFFLRIMSILVAFMGISFISSMFMAKPDFGEIIAGFIPKIPEDKDAGLILSGLVGTTMAAIVLVSRTYLVSEQGWKFNDLKVQNRDAIVSIVLTFLVSACIMAASAATMHRNNLQVEEAIDMVKTLEPLCGRLASTLFVIGIIAAAFSSLFPGYLMGPWMICDYLGIPRKMNKWWVRLFVFIVASTGLFVPVFHGNPVIIMIASQAISPVIMPLLIILLLILLNKKSLTKDHRNPVALNIGLIITLAFSLFMSFTALSALLAMTV